jgi:adenylate kinase family enzyme
MDIYQRETMPVIRHFEDEGLLFRVDADQSIDDVYADIKRLIDRD